MVSPELCQNSGSGDDVVGIYILRMSYNMQNPVVAKKSIKGENISDIWIYGGNIKHKVVQTGEHDSVTIVSPRRA